MRLRTVNAAMPGVLLILVVAFGRASMAQTLTVSKRTPAQPRSVLVTKLDDDLLVVKTTSDAAVVRVGTTLETIRVGDRIGRTHALVKEIVRGRVVLEETFIGADGSPNLAVIVIKDGEKGGTRYLRRAEEKRPIVTQPGRMPEPSTGKKP